MSWWLLPIALLTSPGVVTVATLSELKSAIWNATYSHASIDVIANLTVDGNAYLSAFDTLTVYFLKDLVAGKKKCKC